jgi:hypothetical protein
MTDTLTLAIEDLTPDQVAQLLAFVRAMRTGTLAMGQSVPDESSWRDAPSTGWTREHVEALRRALAERGKDIQLAAFDAAIENGGFMSREDLYALGGYEPTRKLNNWTVPLRNVKAELIAGAGLPKDAELPMEFDYPRAAGYVAARGLVVAPEIVRLMRS